MLVTIPRQMSLRLAGAFIALAVVVIVLPLAHSAPSPPPLYSIPTKTCSGRGALGPSGWGDWDNCRNGSKPFFYCTWGPFAGHWNSSSSCLQRAKNGTAYRYCSGQCRLQAQHPLGFEDAGANCNAQCMWRPTPKPPSKASPSRTPKPPSKAPPSRTPTPSPVPSPVPSPEPSPVPSPVPSPIPSPVPSPVPSPTPSYPPSPSPSPTFQPFIPLDRNNLINATDPTQLFTPVPTPFTGWSGTPSYRPNPSYWANYLINQTALPTSKWWAPWIQPTAAEDYNSITKVMQFPYVLKLRGAAQNQIGIFPANVIAPFDSRVPQVTAAVNYLPAEGFYVSATEPMDTRQVAAFDDMGSATFAWGRSDSLGGFAVPLVRGSPYITFQAENVTLQLLGFSALGFPIQGAGNSTITSNVFKFSSCLNPVSTYMAYFSSNVTLAINSTGSSFTATLTEPFSGTLRVAGLLDRACRPASPGLDSFTCSSPPSPQCSMEGVLGQYADVFPVTGGNLSLGADSDQQNGTVGYSFNLESMSGNTPSPSSLLMYALPFHYQHWASPANSTPAEMPPLDSIRGVLKPMLGSTWTLSVPLSSAAFKHAKPLDNAAYREELGKALAYDASVFPTSWAGGDSYQSAAQLATVARLVLAADSLNDTATRDVLLAKLWGALTPWFEKGQNSGSMWGRDQYFTYESTWGGIVPQLSYQRYLQGGRDNVEYDNYGNAVYNDHHYHYGYYVYAAAVLGQYNASFLEAYSGHLLTLVRDFANPSSQDTHFTFARYMDWWEGHSWTTGLGAFADGTNLGSSSEAIHAYYSVSLLASALNTHGILNSSDLTTFGRVLTAIEMWGSQFYVQVQAEEDPLYSVSASSDTPFWPSGFPNCTRAVGVTWAVKVDIGNWFSNYAETSPTMHVLPVTPITAAHLGSEWSRQAVDWMQNNKCGYVPFDASKDMSSTAGLEDWWGYMLRYTYPGIPAGLGQPIIPGWLAYVLAAQAVYDAPSAWTAAVAIDASQYVTPASPLSAITKTDLLAWIASRP